MSSKLPPRAYYNLTQAARELGCTEDYLIHLGALGMIHVMQYAEVDTIALPIIRYPLAHEDDAELLELRQEPYDNPHGCFYVLFNDSLREYELKGKEKCAFFMDIVYPHTGGAFFHAKTRYEERLESIKARLGMDARFLGFLLQDLVGYSDEGDDDDDIGDDFDELHPPGRTYLAIDPNKLYVLHSEVERLKNGNLRGPLFSEAVSMQEVMAAPIAKAKYTTRLLQIQSEAIQKWWVNYDPAEADTAPTKETIIQWLIEKGCSDRAAKAIDLIIRHEGRKSGGAKPKG